MPRINSTNSHPLFLCRATPGKKKHAAATQQTPNSSCSAADTALRLWHATSRALKNRTRSPASKIASARGELQLQAKAAWVCCTTLRRFWANLLVGEETGRGIAVLLKLTSKCIAGEQVHVPVHTCTAQQIAVRYACSPFLLLHPCPCPCVSLFGKNERLVPVCLRLSRFRQRRHLVAQVCNSSHSLSTRTMRGSRVAQVARTRSRSTCRP